MPRRPTVIAYTQGDCWYLSRVLAEMTGLDVAVVSYENDPSEWCHVGVLLPNGKVLDIEGATTPSEWLRRWSFMSGARAYFELGSWDTAKGYFMNDIYDNSSGYMSRVYEESTRKNTKRVAARLLQTHAPELISV